MADESKLFAFRNALARLEAERAARRERTKQRRVSQIRAEPAEAPSSTPRQDGATGEGQAGGGNPAPSGRARDVIKALGEGFAKLHDKSRVSAWAAWQRHIASNLHILVPSVLNLKEATSLLLEIDAEFMKSEEGASTETPEEFMRNWLNGDEEKVN